MTVNQAIEQAEAMRPGSLDGNAVRWLHSLESRIMTEIAGMNPPVVLDEDYELVAPEGYDRIYPLWIVAQLDLANAEIERYNNDVTAFNEVYEAFTAWWTRMHLPPRKNHIRGVK